VLTLAEAYTIPDTPPYQPIYAPVPDIHTPRTASLPSVRLPSFLDFEKCPGAHQIPRTPNRSTTTFSSMCFSASNALHGRTPDANQRVVCYMGNNRVPEGTVSQTRERLRPWRSWLAQGSCPSVLVKSRRLLGIVPVSACRAIEQKVRHSALLFSHCL
jgi:hypothetical protein